MKLDIDIDTTKLFKSLELVDDDIKKALRKQLIKDMIKVKSDAKRDHRFNNRTGKLEGNIKASLDEDKDVISGFVYVNDKKVPYAKFVHDGTKNIKADKFLNNALDKNEKMILKNLQEALDKAIKDFNKG